MLATAALQPLTAQQSTPAAGQAAPAAGQAAPQQKKEIKDPAEYNAYVNAVQQTDPAAKATAVESFLQTYPNSVMKTDAMELLMGAYQQAGNQQKTMDTATVSSSPILTTSAPSPCSLTATVCRPSRVVPTPRRAHSRLPTSARKVLRPCRLCRSRKASSDADFEKLKKETSVIFNGAAGFGALNTKDYASAQTGTESRRHRCRCECFLPRCLPTRTRLPRGQPDQSRRSLVHRACRRRQRPPRRSSSSPTTDGKKFNKYHGSEEGWPELLTAAASSATAPAGFTVAACSSATQPGPAGCRPCQQQAGEGYELRRVAADPVLW